MSLYPPIARTRRQAVPRQPRWRRETDLIQQYRHMAVLTQGYRCFYCRDAITHENSTADHKSPRAEGGKTEQSNILASCLICNQAKGTISYRKFMECITSLILPCLQRPESKYPTKDRIRKVWVRRRLNLRVEQAEKRIKRAIRFTEPNAGFVAMLLRTDFDHAKSRTHLFRDSPVFASKVVLLKRIVWFADDNGKPKASPSFNHCWMIWNHRHEGPATISYAGDVA